jgi:hypothetical protein
MSTLEAYAGWLSELSERDREYVRTQHAEVAATCAADPNAEPWLEYLYRWTEAALGANDPAAALAGAVAATVGKSEQIGRALEAIEKITNEWEERYRPSSSIVGSPYPSKAMPEQ